jgi:hypothetical protein
VRVMCCVQSTCSGCQRPCVPVRVSIDRVGGGGADGGDKKRELASALDLIDFGLWRVPPR